MRYNVGVLHFELIKAGLKIEGVDSTGNISWVGDPGAEELATAQEVLEAHDPSKVVEMTINMLELLATEFYEDEAELVNWGKESFFIQTIMTDKEFKATSATVALLKQRVKESKDNPDSALSDVLADKLIAKLTELEDQLAQI